MEGVLGNTLASGGRYVMPDLQDGNLGSSCISLDSFHQSVITNTWDFWTIHYFSEKCAVLPFLQRQHSPQLHSPRLPEARHGAGLRKATAGPGWAPAVRWSPWCGGTGTGRAGSRSLGLCRANTGSLCCLAPLSHETRVLTLAVAHKERKKVFKNAIAIVRLKYFRHRYRDTL